MIAKGMGGRIAVIDTERGSADLYCNIADYDTAQITEPFTPQKYITAIKEAETEGYDVIIIDSLSHAWTGEGGLLDLHDKATKASKSKNSFDAWREVTPLHNKLVDAILNSKCHMIITTRVKTAYEIVENDKGKKAPVKIGMSPVFRDGIEYEFTVVFDLSVDGHIATSTKDRTRLFDGQYTIPSEETGKVLMQWLNTGTDNVSTPEVKPEEKKQPPATPEERFRALTHENRIAELHRLIAQKGYDVTRLGKPLTDPLWATGTSIFSLHAHLLCLPDFVRKTEPDPVPAPLSEPEPEPPVEMPVQEEIPFYTGDPDPVPGPEPESNPELVAPLPEPSDNDNTDNVPFIAEDNSTEPAGRYLHCTRDKGKRPHTSVCRERDCRNTCDQFKSWRNGDPVK
jgi:hypothetical protein